MASLQTVHLAHTPPELALYAALYHDVKNAAFLRDQLLAGNTDYEYAFIDASMILSKKHILSAVFRAINDYLNDRLKSRNVHSEIVFCLSSNNNIGEAFRRFGVGENTTSLLVLKVATSSEVTFQSVQNHLVEAIDGIPIAFEDDNIRSFSDLSRIKKVYKLGNSAPSKAMPKSSKPLTNVDTTMNTKRDERTDLETSVIGLISLRGAT